MIFFTSSSGMDSMMLPVVSALCWTLNSFEKSPANSTSIDSASLGRNTHTPFVATRLSSSFMMAVNEISPFRRETKMSFFFT